jgi:hypothetical protein
MKTTLDPDGMDWPGQPSRDEAVRQGLLNRVSLALRIARRTVRFLGADGFNGADSPDGNFAAEKPLAETAILLYVVSRERADPRVQEEFDDLLQELIPYARSKRMGWDVLRYPSVAIQLATPHILLGILGRPDFQFSELLSKTEDACARRGHEVVAYRELEIIWLRSLWRNEAPGCELEKTGRRTALGNPIDLLNGTRDDAYALTHAFMYYTDFGNWQRPLPRPAPELLGEAAAVLVRALVIEDYDLAAEALMAWPLTSSTLSPTAAFGFRVLASLEDKVGYLPFGRFASRRLLELAGEEKTKYALASSYHTAYLMGMLCALCLKAGTASPFEIVGPPLSMTLIERLEASISKGGAHWERVFQSLRPNEQASLGPFLLDVALIQSSRKGNFAHIAGLLEVAVQNGLGDTALCAQSAELLSRVAAFAGWDAQV